MTAFYKQQWFKDALPYAAGALAAAGAVAGIGAANGWFDSSPSSGGFSGIAAGDGGSDVGTFGYDGPISQAARAADVPGMAGAVGVAGQAGQAAEGAAKGGQGLGGLLRGVPVLGDAVDFVQQNPSMLLMGGLTLAQLLASQGQNQQKPNAVQGAQDQIAASNAVRDNDIARWNAIPYTDYRTQPVYGRARNPNAPQVRGGERRYFADGGAIGQEMRRHSNGYLQGPGDGMSDDIPAVAHGQNGDRRPVNVADGEYVIAADVVSGLGNGSTDAGVRFLDGLQHRVRGARTGGRQPDPINPRDLLRG